MNRRALLTSLIAATPLAAVPATKTLAEKVTIPRLPTFPADMDPQVIGRAKATYWQDLYQFASQLEDAILMFKQYPSLVLAAEFPPLLREAIRLEGEREPFSYGLNDDVLAPDYFDCQIADAEECAAKHRAEEAQKQRAEEEKAAKEAADAQKRELTYEERKMFTQRELSLDEVYQSLAEKLSVLQPDHQRDRIERLKAGWTIEPGEFGIGPDGRVTGPDRFSTIDAD